VVIGNYLMPSSTLLPTPVAIVVGASSGIGAALAHELARTGHAVALVARRAEALAALAEQINTQHGEHRARVYPHDATHFDEVPALFQTILRDMGRVDAVIYNSGVMPRVALNEYNFDKDREMVAVNVLGAMAWLNQAAVLFEHQGFGHLVGIGSVAGDRGRVGAPVYNASKAALATYLEALRNRLTRKGVHVLTVKPGPVRTAMLEGVARPLWPIAPEQAARDIVRAIRARKQVIYTPARWGMLMFVIRHLPSFIFRRLSF
jgi:decaprenylphospho-beta-D-erythro-pentofuranosid-2-ulose 2-reductase